MKFFSSVMGIVFSLSLMVSCNKETADQGNYKYSAASWQGTNVYAEQYHGAIQKSRNLIKAATSQNGLPGAQIAVAIDGEIRWSENFGFADLEKGETVKKNTLFRIASVSKMFTAAAVGKLVEAGKLDLDKPVIDYLPDLPEHYSKITTRHLVSHQSGIRHYYGADRSEKTIHFDDVNDALDLFVNAPLLFEPGTDCFYSSYSWLLISAVIQQVSGKPFLEFMQEEIWQPVGLTNTFGDIPADRKQNVTRFYIKNNAQGNWQEAPDQDMSFNWAGAGMSSNANDLAKFGMGLLDGKLFSKSTFQMMLEPQLTHTGDTTGFGIGFLLYDTNNGEKIAGHSGFIPTGRAFLLLFPESNLVIAFTCNTAMINFADENLVAIAHQFLNEKANPTHFVFDRALFENWKGLWQVEWEQNDGYFKNNWLNFYEEGAALKCAVISGNNAPITGEIINLKKDSISLLAPFPSHTVRIELALKEDSLSGQFFYDKLMTKMLKKRLENEPEFRKILCPKKMKNGKKIY